MWLRSPACSFHPHILMLYDEGSAHEFRSRSLSFSRKSAWCPTPGVKSQMASVTKPGTRGCPTRGGPHLEKQLQRNRNSAEIWVLDVLSSPPGKSCHLRQNICLNSMGKKMRAEYLSPVLMLKIDIDTLARVNLLWHPFLTHLVSGYKLDDKCGSVEWIMIRRKGEKLRVRHWLNCSNSPKFNISIECGLCVN